MVAACVQGTPGASTRALFSRRCPQAPGHGQPDPQPTCQRIMYNTSPLRPSLLGNVQLGWKPLTCHAKPPPPVSPSPPPRMTYMSVLTGATGLGIKGA